MTGAGVSVGPLVAGPGHPPLFFPDIDVYFKGDVGLALMMLERLKSAGSPIVKGALIHDVDLCYADAVDATYHDPTRGQIRESYREVLKRHVLPLADAQTIYARARELGFVIILSVYDYKGVDFAIDCGAAALKVPSSNITHAPLIRYASAKRLPLVLDTGKSTLAEIARAVAWAREAGADRLILQHSPEAPPAALDRHHLRMIPTLSRLFHCPTGLSDHHSGSEMMLAAVALGASVIEKGVCADDAAADIDIAHAARVSDVAAMIVALQNVWLALGSDMRTLPAGRQRPADRAGLVAASEIPAGQSLRIENIRFAIAVPSDAIGVEEWDRVEGWVADSDVRKGQYLRWDMIRPNRFQ